MADRYSIEQDTLVALEQARQHRDNLLTYIGDLESRIIALEAQVMETQRELIHNAPALQLINNITNVLKEHEV